MTAGVLLEKLGDKERYFYVTGLVHGLGYARFRKDTIASGKKDEQGLTCINDWFYQSKGKRYLQIEDVFRKYPKHYPGTLVAHMIKEACGE